MIPGAITAQTTAAIAANSRVMARNVTKYGRYTARARPLQLNAALPSRLALILCSARRICVQGNNCNSVSGNRQGIEEAAHAIGERRTLHAAPYAAPQGAAETVALR